jgi:hypothetical protein
MRPDDPIRQPRHCEDHDRLECTRRRKNGSPCHGSAIAGTDRCRMHAGERSEVARAKGEAITAWSALSGTPTVTASDAVLHMLQMSWLRVHLYAELLEEQVAAEQAAREAGGRPLELEVHEGDGDGDEWYEAHRVDVGEGAGLVGVTRSGVKGLGIFVTGEAIRGLAQLEAAERDRCVKFAKTAHDMGIAESHLKLVESYTAELAGLIGRILDGLDLTPEQRHLVSVVVPRELSRAS